MRKLVWVLLALAFVGIIEKTSRYTYDSTVFVPKKVPVLYEWNSKPWATTLADPVNVGSSRKWFGLKTFDAYVEIPSNAYPSRWVSISRDAINRISPVKGGVYSCINGFWTIVCSGPLYYEVDPYKADFRKRPHSDWLNDVRWSTITIYKFF